MPSSAQQGIDFIPKYPDQVVSVQLAVGFYVPDDRLDCASPFELSFHLGRHASFSAGDKNLRVLNAMSPVSSVNITLSTALPVISRICCNALDNVCPS